MKVAVITCSNRSAAGERADDSGEVLAALFEGAGHQVAFRTIVADEIQLIRDAVSMAMGAGAEAIVTTGGTGLTPSDVTPEAVHAMFDREIPGIADAIRMVGRETVPTSVLSRGVAGAIGQTLVVTLPGSPGGVRDGMGVLLPVLDHAVEQLGGGDHRPGGGV